MKRCIGTALIAFLAAACGGETIEIPARNPTPIDPATTGTIAGVARLAGTPPPARAIPMGGFPGCLDARGAPLTDAAVRVQDGGLADVFVHISGGLEEMVFAVPAEPAVIDQQGCEYVPRVIGVQRYQPIAIRNSDALLHNVHAQPAAQPGFNFGQAVAGLENRVQFREDEVMVPLKCDVHGWMQAYVGVVDHPYFAVTGAGGAFRLENVPPGTYTLRAWHEVYGELSTEVVVPERGEAAVEFEFAG